MLRETLLQALRGCIKNGGHKMGEKIRNEVSLLVAGYYFDDLNQVLGLLNIFLLNKII